MTADTLTQASAADSARSAARLGTILCHVQNDDSVSTRLDAALSLARATGAHLQCLHITPIEAYAAFDAYGGVFAMNEALKTFDEEEEKLKARVEKEIANEDVTWDYVDVTGNVPSQLLRYGALADLVITGREPHPTDLPGPLIGQLGDLLARSRTPLFIPSSKVRAVDPTGTVLVGWNGSYEAATAVRAAVPLLRFAEKVRVLQIREEGKDEQFPGTMLLKYLSRHGIHAELDIEPPRNAKNEQIASVLLAHASAHDSSYIVLGGYSRNRIGEYLFGGVTRSLLRDCDYPVFITC